ncbi:hypothetical protein A2Y85_02075 [candidate division WOR-3 bacterium RBG_13_43_14]|uniref:Uncharacterized protein n=1 Tax=candidate division WOR-3 bacterium RBG_13_43_14 TaxID=1802590 RepID=A0A1F4U934_UNCW3|nr:MAG: hypothetical protein A2Y85_02075 [candidate division WOR-3 bacterium RBG_13_43_14]
MLILILIINALSAGQSNDAALKLADKYFDNGLYDHAITEYKRYLFLKPTSPFASQLHQRIAQIYRDQHQWAWAIEAYRQAIACEANDSIQAELEIDLAITYLAASNYSAGEFQLIKTSIYNDDPAIKKRAAFFLSIAALHNHKWDDAEKYFNDYFEYCSDPNLKIEFDSVFQAVRKKKLKSASLAMWLSTLLPGSGQLYVGDYENALNAFALNGVFGYWIGSRLLLKDWGNALLIWHFLARRYYFGNRYHARRIAEEYNQNLKQEEINSILDCLQ